MSNSSLQFRILDGFNDPAVSQDNWNALVTSSPTNEIFLTWHWQSTWWQTFGRGQLLLIIAEDKNRLVAIAPLFADNGMVFFVGSGGSDYLDFIGDISLPGVLKNFLSIAAAATTGFCGFRFYHIPDQSPTGNLLAKESGSGKWTLYEEGELPSPFLHMELNPARALLATRKKTIRYHENWFRNSGELEITHSSVKEDIIPQLDSFFLQHISRWSATDYPSLFLSETQRQFYLLLCQNLTAKDFVRFSVIKWRGVPIAYHFGFWYQKKFFLYKPSYDTSLAKYSPGMVMIRHLLLQAIQDQAEIFDFGLGDEEFKNRFATGVKLVKTWGLYPLNN